MTLLIACLLIYHMGLTWPFYVLAVALWIFHVLARAASHESRVNLAKSNDRLAEVMEARGV